MPSRPVVIHEWTIGHVKYPAPGGTEEQRHVEMVKYGTEAVESCLKIYRPREELKDTTMAEIHPYDRFVDVVDAVVEALAGDYNPRLTSEIILAAVHQGIVYRLSIGQF